MSVLCKVQAWISRWGKGKMIGMTLESYLILSGYSISVSSSLSSHQCFSTGLISHRHRPFKQSSRELLLLVKRARYNRH